MYCNAVLPPGGNIAMSHACLAPQTAHNTTMGNYTTQQLTYLRQCLQITWRSLRGCLDGKKKKGGSKGRRKKSEEETGCELFVGTIGCARGMHGAARQSVKALICVLCSATSQANRPNLETVSTKWQAWHSRLISRDEEEKLASGANGVWESTCWSGVEPWLPPISSCCCAERMSLMGEYPLPSLAFGMMGPPCSAATCCGVSDAGAMPCCRSSASRLWPKVESSTALVPMVLTPPPPPPPPPPARP